MRIIICGVDGCLKTTIAKQLIKRLKEPHQYVKESVPPKDISGFDYYMKRCDELPEDCIVDRFHIGESVYPFVKNDGRTALTLKQLQEIERKLIVTSKTGVALILCSSSLDWREWVWNNRGETFITLEQSETVKKSFEFAFILSLIQLKYRFYVDDYLLHELTKLAKPSVNEFKFVTKVLYDLNSKGFVRDFVKTKEEYNSISGI